MKSRLFILLFFLLSENAIQAQTYQLWGMTVEGGDFGFGIIFNINEDGTGFVSHHSFGTVGHFAAHSLIQASDGKFYGLTRVGGSTNKGVLFRFDPSNDDCTRLHSFAIDSGSVPRGTLLQASNGLLYGMTSSGGANNGGVIFSFNIVDSTYTRLFDFDSISGMTPAGSLIQARNGLLYGMANSGGTFNNGTIFSFSTSTSSFTKLFDIDSTSTGSFPYSGLIEGNDSLLYGMTSQGGDSGMGVLFSYKPTGDIFTKLHDFSLATGSQPGGNVLQASDGILYGTTGSGGANGDGVIFNYDISTHAYSDIFDFVDSLGKWPSAEMIQASNGKLYGMTPNGGTFSSGVLYSFATTTHQYTKIFEFNGNDGSFPAGDFIEVMTTGIAETKKGDNSFSVYPNPAKDNFTIRFNSALNPEREMSISIYNVLGEKIYSAAINAKQKTINSKLFSSGMYLVRADDGEKIVSQRLIIE